MRNDDLIGQRFGMLVVIDHADDLVTQKGYKHERYLCKCDCGNITIKTKRALLIDKTKSCGCLVGKSYKNLEGMRFGQLLVTSIDHVDKNGYYWNCKCDCGKDTVVRSSSLLNGDTKSCGCMRKEILLHETHGMTGTRLYRIWSGMKDRCLNPHSKYRKRYRDRGIRICQEWLDDFMNFYDWAMGSGYADNLSIDRIDVNGNYEPSNCRWATSEIQGNNKGNNVFLVCDGKRQTISEWAKELHIQEGTIRARLNRGWSTEKALSLFSTR